MYSQKVTVTNQIGLVVRPSNIFTKVASEYSSSIHVKYKGVLVNGKSYLGLLSRAVPNDAEIEIIANGADEITAVDTLVNLVKSNFSNY